MIDRKSCHNHKSQNILGNFVNFIEFLCYESWLYNIDHCSINYSEPVFLGDIQVIIRVRPLSNSEISVQGHSTCVKQDSSQTITWTGHPESRFTFDLILLQMKMLAR